MGFRFEPSETVPVAVRRVALEQLSVAIDHLVAVEGRRDKHVHEARKCMKRLRGLVRLVRRDLGADNYLRENATFRDAAGRISGLRDAAVRVQTLDKLVAYCGRDLPRSRFAMVRSWLVRRRKATYNRLTAASEVVRGIARELEHARERVPVWTVAEEDWSGVAAGLKRVYSRGRQEYRQVYRDPSDEGFHDWRKSVKYLWYHAQLLGWWDPPALAVMVEELDQLGELLGDDHDLVLLEDTLLEEYPKGRAPATVRALRHRITRKRRHLQLAARAVGSRVYLEKPAAFLTRCYTVGTSPGNGSGPYPQPTASA
jgi:CHAD domain-containing protein